MFIPWHGLPLTDCQNGPYRCAVSICHFARSRKSRLCCIYICVTLHVVGMLMTWIMLLQRSCSCECHWVMSLTRMRQVTVARLDEWESYRWYKFATLHVLCVSMTRICRSHATPLVTELSVEYVLICQTVQYNLNLCLAQVRLFIKFWALQDCTLEKA